MGRKGKKFFLGKQFKISYDHEFAYIAILCCKDFDVQLQCAVNVWISATTGLRSCR